MPKRDFHHEHGNEAPKIFQSEIGLTKLCNFNCYTIEESRLNIIKGGLNHILFLIIIFSGVLPFDFFFGPLAVALSRRYEREADMYSLKIQGTSEPPIKALKKMALDYLSNLRPHPLYGLLNYSHPHLVQRIDSLQKENLTGLK